MHTITSEELRSEPSAEETLSAAGASGGKVPIGNQDGDHHWEHVRLKEFMAIECYDTDQPQERVERSRDRECNCRPSSPAHLLPSFNIFCFFVGHSTSPLKCRERRMPPTPAPRSKNKWGQSRFNWVRRGSALGGRPLASGVTRRPMASAICRLKGSSPSAQPPLVAALRPSTKPSSSAVRKNAR